MKQLKKEKAKFTQRSLVPKGLILEHPLCLNVIELPLKLNSTVIGIVLTIPTFSLWIGQCEISFLF